MQIKLPPPDPKKPLVERAFELAASGQYSLVEHIERALSDEGYPRGSAHWNSTTLRKQLRAACRKATGAGPAVAQS